MKKELFVFYLLLCMGTCSNAQQNPRDYDTIPIVEEHYNRDFVLYAIVPKMFTRINIEQVQQPCRVYIQIDAHIDVDKEGKLADIQNNSSKITILAIKEIETERYLYSKRDELDGAKSTYFEELNSYFQNKFANVHYYLSGDYSIPSELTFYYVEDIQ